MFKLSDTLIIGVAGLWLTFLFDAWGVVNPKSDIEAIRTQNILQGILNAKNAEAILRIDQALREMKDDMKEVRKKFDEQRGDVEGMKELWGLNGSNTAAQFHKFKQVKP